MKSLFVVILLLIFNLACLKEDKKQCDYNPCSSFAPASEVSTLEGQLAANSVTATKHCSGFFYIIDAAGSGASPDICSTVSVKYKGQLTTNGNVFDEATTAVSFPLAGLIEAWQKGLLLLKPGGKMKMWVPPSLAYGSQEIRNSSGVVIIPANSTLYFEIELVAIS